MDWEDWRVRMVILKVLAARRAERTDGPRVPFAPIRAMFLSGMLSWRGMVVLILVERESEKDSDVEESQMVSLSTFGYLKYTLGLA